MEIDLIELADIGNPARLASALLDQIPDLTPGTPVRRIAAAVGIEDIHLAPLDRFEGALITDRHKRVGQILINQCQGEQRQRFTIAHELGHFLLDNHRSKESEGFRCSRGDFAADRTAKMTRAMKMEVEANEFAAELLMPTRLVGKLLARSPGVEMEHILRIAAEFNVSKESAARCYVSLVGEPVALVFSRDGIIRYIKKSAEFPSLCVWKDQPVPEDSLTGTIKDEVGKISDWSTCPADTWLSSARRGHVCEQTFPQQNGFRISLLAMEEDEGDDDDDWHEPRFAYGR
jgi:hypothetical protein